MGDEEPYDYKFVKWMIKEKVLFFILGIYNITEQSIVIFFFFLRNWLQFL